MTKANEFFKIASSANNVLEYDKMLVACEFAAYCGHYSSTFGIEPTQADEIISRLRSDGFHVVYGGNLITVGWRIKNP